VSPLYTIFCRISWYLESIPTRSRKLCGVFSCVDQCGATSKMTYLSRTCSRQISKGEDFGRSMRTLVLSAFLQSRRIRNENRDMKNPPLRTPCRSAPSSLHPCHRPPSSLEPGKRHPSGGGHFHRIVLESADPVTRHRKELCTYISPFFSRCFALAYSSTRGYPCVRSPRLLR
jgi:hypothetical protein